MTSVDWDHGPTARDCRDDALSLSDDCNVTRNGEPRGAWPSPGPLARRVFPRRRGHTSSAACRRSRGQGARMSKRVLVVDVGGTNVKVYGPGRAQPLKMPSGPKFTPKRMIAGVRRAVASQGLDFEAVSIGIPAPVARGKVLREPANLGRGWTRFDFAKALSKPVRIVNDAAMQALGSYNGGTMLFLGLGTGLGSALILDGSVHAMELAHLPYKRGTYEDYVGIRGLEKHGKKKWRRLVADVVEILMDALRPEEVVLGGGNVKKLKELPLHCRAGENADAFRGGFRLWEERVTSGHPRIRIA